MVCRFIDFLTITLKKILFSSTIFDADKIRTATATTDDIHSTNGTTATTAAALYTATTATAVHSMATHQWPVGECNASVTATVDQSATSTAAATAASTVDANSTRSTTGRQHCVATATAANDAATKHATGSANAGRPTGTYQSPGLMGSGS
jgi:hypothetical protein